MLSNYYRPWVEAALDRGFDVWVGINRDNPEEIRANLPVRFYDAVIYRSIWDLRSNLRALLNLVSLIKEENIQVIHCNSPIGGLVGRLAGAMARVNTVIYTAHGFHFYDGAPPVRGAVYRSVEQFLGRFTDTIITINSEDYQAANRMRSSRLRHVALVPGVGISCDLFQRQRANREGLMRELSLPRDAVIAIGVGDLVPGKNYALALKVLAASGCAEAHLLICGRGARGRVHLERLASSLGVADRVHFLGYRTDIARLLCNSDLFVHLSKREGLPRVAMEAMAAGLPLLLTDVRGNRDLVVSGAAARIHELNDLSGLRESFRELVNEPALRAEMGEENRRQSTKYDVGVVAVLAKDIYEDVLGDS